MTDDSAPAPLAPGPIARSAVGLMGIVSDLSRGEYFAGLFILGCVSALATRIFHSIEDLGWAAAFSNTFGISVLIWVSCISGVALVLRDRTVGVDTLEIALGVGFVFLIVLPIGSLGWIGVTGLSLYILFSEDIADSRRGAFILMATTIPIFWSPLLFEFFARYILAADAILVSWILGTHRSGNIVELGDHSGQLVIFPACSSIANVSLAVLCWVTLSQIVSHKRSKYDLLWCLLACAAVVAVNVTRMAILGLGERPYVALHNQLSDTVVNVITLGLIVGISSLGIRRELLQHF